MCLTCVNNFGSVQNNHQNGIGKLKRLHDGPAVLLRGQQSHYISYLLLLVVLPVILREPVCVSDATQHCSILSKRFSEDKNQFGRCSALNSVVSVEVVR